MLAAWLNHFFVRHPTVHYLYPHPAADLRALLRDCLIGIGFKDPPFGLSSFRAGAATHRLVTDPNSLPALQFAGRWKNSSTLHHYIQVSAAAFGAATIPGEIRNTVDALACYFDGLGPPPADF